MRLFRSLLLASALFMVACDNKSMPVQAEQNEPVAPVVSSAQCMKDTDCKFDRICERGVCTAPPPQAAVTATPVPATASVPESVSKVEVVQTQQPDPAQLAGKLLEQQLACNGNPEPGKVIRSMINDGLLKNTDNGADGIPVLEPTLPILVFGKPLRFVAGWEQSAGVS